MWIDVLVNSRRDANNWKFVRFVSSMAW